MHMLGMCLSVSLAPFYDSMHWQELHAERMGMCCCRCRLCPT